HIGAGLGFIGRISAGIVSPLLGSQADIRESPRVPVTSPSERARLTNWGRAGESRSATMVRIAFGSLPAGLHHDDVCAKSRQSDFDICGGRPCSRGAYSLR